MIGDHAYGTAVIVGPGYSFAEEMITEFRRIARTILLVARDRAHLDHLASVARNYDRVATLAADVTAHDFETRLQSVLRELEPVRVVVYNVKMSPKGDVGTVAVSEFTSAFAANVSGSLAVMKVLLSDKITRTPDAVFVNTGGGFKDVPDPSRLALSVSKAGIHNLTLGMKLNLLNGGIRAKTLVIDGVVGEDGPITPPAVARQMIELVRSPKKDVGRIGPVRLKRRGTRDAGKQLDLFDDEGRPHAI